MAPSYTAPHPFSAPRFAIGAFAAFLASCGPSIAADAFKPDLLAKAAQQAKFTLAEACAIARQAVPGVVVSAEMEVEREGAGLDIEYEILILEGGRLIEVEVDAISGRVTEIEGQGGGAPTSDPAAPTGTTMELAFDDVRTGGLPAGWTILETYGVGRPAHWQVRADPSGERGRYLALSETTNQGRTYNLLLTDAVYPANLDLSVLVRAETGVEDQGGGLMWRALDAENYYVTRWNPLEDNLRVYRVVAGDRQQLMSAKVSVDSDTWHTITVSSKGARITIGFDGETQLDLEDPTFGKPGRVGLWTKADAATSFDDFRVRIH